MISGISIDSSFFSCSCLACAFSTSSLLAMLFLISNPASANALPTADVSQFSSALVLFINVVAFTENSRVLYSHAKDEEIHCEGYIKSGSYEKDGRKVYTQDLVIEKFYGIKKKNEIEDWMK